MEESVLCRRDGDAERRRRRHVHRRRARGRGESRRSVKAILARERANSALRAAGGTDSAIDKVIIEQARRAFDEINAGLVAVKRDDELTTE
jgi:hypothetical protein